MSQSPADALVNLNAIALPATITRKADGCFLAVNSAFIEAFGFTEAEVLGRTTGDIGLYHVKEQRSLILDEVRRTGCIKAHELQFCTKSNKVLTCLLSLKPTSYGGEECLLSTIIDITDQRELERKYQAIFASASDAILLIDKGMIVDCNQRAIEVSELSRDQIVGKPPHYFAPHVQPDDTPSESFAEGKIDAALQGFPQRFEWHNIFPNSSHHYSEVILSRVWLEERWMLMAIVRDITQNKKAEEDLLKSQKRLAQIIEFLPDPMFAVDKHRRVIVWNRAMEKMTGVRAGDILMEGPYSYGNAFYGHRRPMLIDFLFDPPDNIYPYLYRDEDAIFAESDLVTLRNGRRAYLWGKASLLHDVDGKVFGAIEVIRDITEQKTSRVAVEKSESRLRLALDAVNEGVWDTDMKNGTCYFSPRWYTMLGYDPDEFEASLSAWKSLVHPDDLSAIEKTIVDNMSGADPKDYFQDEYRMRTKNGAWRWILSRGRVVSRDKSGKVLRIIGTHSDMTDRRLMEREMLRAEKLEAIGILAGGIAHDFNNLLTVIISNISSACMQLNHHSKVSGKLKSAEKAAERARDLTTQLLTFSKAEMPSKKTTSISHVIRESAEFILPGSNVLCNVDITDDVWPVDIDAGQMSQVINNLIINASQAMPEGGTISISVENMQLVEDVWIGNSFPLRLPMGRYLVIAVKDHGVGIAPEHLNSIFDPYFTTKQQGSGLGLACVQSIIKKHGGFITVDSIPNLGTQFSIYLPASSTPAHEQIDPKKHTNEHSPESARILVLDDDESIRNSITEILMEAGHVVVESGNVEQAYGEYITAYESGMRFDLVITDLTIPGGLGGKDLMKKILAVDPSVKAIVSSGYATDIIMANYRDFGFCYNLAKPYRAQQLLEAVNLVLSSPKSSLQS